MAYNYVYNYTEYTSYLSRQEYELLQGNDVRVNGSRVNLPYNDLTVRVKNAGRFVVRLQLLCKYKFFENAIS